MVPSLSPRKLRIFEGQPQTKFLRNSRKSSKNSFKNQDFSRILENFGLRVALNTPRILDENEVDSFEVEGKLIALILGSKFENLLRGILKNSQISRQE